MLGLQCAAGVSSSLSHLLVLQQKTEHKEVAKHLVFTLPIEQFEHRRVTGLWHIKLWPAGNQGCFVIVSPDSFTVSQTGCMKMVFVFLNAAHQWWWKKMSEQMNLIWHHYFLWGEWHFKTSHIKGNFVGLTTSWE